MKTKIYRYYNNSYPLLNNITIEVSLKCPHCGLPTAFINHNLIVSGDVIPFRHRCPNCEKSSYSFQIVKNKEWSLGAFYPQHISEGIPEIISQHCPNFSRIYSQAQQAEQEGSLELAAIGYRSAAEYIIKDYALAFELDPKENIVKQNLKNSIERYFKDDILAFNTAEVIRIFGNDFTHWDKSFDMPFAEMKMYMDIMIKTFEMKFLQKFPIVSR